jgi:2',3'-cyclic-nucleotide 2'-phosphodiesterase (5'-nucleotidase family)
LVLDSGGSLFQGSYYDTSENPNLGAVIVDAMNAMGYDAMALGQRDLRAPLTTVQARFEEADFPILSANVESRKALPNLQPYLLRQVGGHTVAVIGVTPASARERLKELDAGELAPDIVAAVQRTVKKVSKDADVVLLLSTLKRSATEALAQAVPGIDAIIGVDRGGQLDPVAIPGAEGEVVLHAAGTLGERLGVLTLHLDEEGQVTGFDGRAVALTDVYPDDPDILQILREHARQQ